MTAANLTQSVPTASEGVKRLCGHCGANFRPTKKWQRFCSDSCRSRFHKASSAEARIKALETKVAALEARVARLEK